MEAKKSLINDIFNGFKILEIPFFQRTYVWDTPQWERFVEDMESVSVENNPYFKAYIHFKENLSPDKIDPKRLQSNLMFVVVDLGIEDDEQKIFDTINSLGVKLTTAELLKNYFSAGKILNSITNTGLPFLKMIMIGIIGIPK
ncbi:MAG: DUF262 domain-containing protein [Treponema sp.]|jgi:uncharacterized protein with ParB-like and HNH nuclease domain|nr:DUF262 domain-containing protein [Treponema sp.]